MVRPPKRSSIWREQFWNLPNVLTLLRVAIIPWFVWLTYDADPWSSFQASIVVTLASLTDVVDGFIARRWNLVTLAGKLMDPLADKLLVMAALVMMARLGRIEAWVIILLLARELIVSGLRQIAASEGLVIAAGQEGKWKTSLQLVGIVALCIHYVHVIDFGVAAFPVDFNLVGRMLMYASTAFSVWSGATYFRAFFAHLEPEGHRA